MALIKTYGNSPSFKKPGRVLGRKALAKSVFLGRGILVTLSMPAFTALMLACINPAEAGTGDRFLVPQKSTIEPAGFSGLCARYTWVCKQSSGATMSDANALKLAETVNLHVNRSVREIADVRQYGKVEHWALPTKRGGDCEDLVLLKKKLLVARGIASKRLLMSTVLDKQLKSHAVLVLRTSKGDYVLDNLTNDILPWTDTGYTFLKLQNPKALSRWHAVMSGGVISDRPTASR